MSDLTNEQKAAVCRRAAEIQQEKGWNKGDWLQFTLEGAPDFFVDFYGYDSREDMLADYAAGNSCKIGMSADDYFRSKCDPKTVSEAVTSVCLEGAILLACIEAGYSRDDFYDLLEDLTEATNVGNLFHFNDRDGQTRDNVVAALGLFAEYFEKGGKLSLRGLTAALA